MFTLKKKKKKGMGQNTESLVIRGPAAKGENET